jgi:MFS family permease
VPVHHPVLLEPFVPPFRGLRVGFGGVADYDTKVSYLTRFFGGIKRQWVVLGVAVLGLTTTATVLTFFLPLVLNQITSSQLAIGFAVGIEGVAALTVPLLIGRASDQTRHRFGRRIPYMIAATPLIVAGLVLVGLLHSYWALVGAVFIFFVGYYAYYTAYQALYPDLLPPDQYGRAWAYQSVFQGAGVAIALLGGGALTSGGLSLTFYLAAGFFVVVALTTFFTIREPARPTAPMSAALLKALPHFLGRIREDRNLRLFLPAHFCWEFTLAAIRAFVILYLVKGLGFSHGQIVPILGGVIVIYLIASLVSGYIADHFDPRHYTVWVIALYAVGQLVTGLTTNEHVLLASFPFGMFAGAAIMMLSYPILLRMTPADRRGEYTGYYQFNRGLALLLGTSLTGLCIDRFGHYFPGSGGFQVLWLVTGAVTALSIPFYLAITGKSQLAKTAEPEVAAP